MTITPFDDAADLSGVLDAAHAAARAFLRSLSARSAAAHPPELERAMLPEHGLGAIAALARFRSVYEPWLSGSAGPRYLGFVTGGTTPAALAGDWLVSAYDQNVASSGDSAATEVEAHTLAMLRSLFGLPDFFEGAFVSGATQANLVGIATARQWAYERVGIDVAEHGLAGAPRLRLVGATPHASIDKVVGILGLGRDSIERVACLPGRQAVDPAALEARLGAGAAGAPCVVLASAGEVNTGDFDDLRAVAAVARRHGAWLHVDGSFGLFAACDPTRATLLDGFELADSIAVDGHKWLNVPYDSGVAFTRHVAQQQSVFKAVAAYFGAAPDLSNRTPENSRRFRALPAWMTLVAYGRSGHRELVQRGCACAAALGRRIEASPHLELLAPVRLNIVCFALRAHDAATRDRLLDAVQRDGRAFLTPTHFLGRCGLRAAFSNWATTEADVATIADALDECARRVLA